MIPRFTIGPAAMALALALLAHGAQAAVGLNNAGKQFHQRTFPRAVFPEDSVHRTSAKRDAGAGNSDRLAVSLHQALGPDRV